MSLFSRWLPAVVLLPLLLAGCKGLDSSSDEPKTLQPIHYYYNNITASYEMDVKISPNNDVHVWTRGPTAADTRTPFYDMLTPAERTALIASFKGWNKLNPFYPTDVSPQYTITYNGYAVTTTKLEGLPPTFLRAKEELDRIAGSMINAYDARQVKLAARAPAIAAATKPATRPASQPATQPATPGDPPDALPVPLGH
jgi:hypothetical protein